MYYMKQVINIKQSNTFNVVLLHMSLARDPTKMILEQVTANVHINRQL